MTAQFPETIFIEDEKRALYSVPPVIDPASELSARIEFVSPSTALWRGYIGCWHMIAAELWLVDLAGVAIGDGLSPRADEDEAPIEWIITDGWLGSLTLPVPDGARNVRLRHVYGADRPMLAQWVSMALFLPHGEVLNHFHAGFGIATSHFRRLDILKGRLVRDRIVPNREGLPAAPATRWPRARPA